MVLVAFSKIKKLNIILVNTHLDRQDIIMVFGLMNMIIDVTYSFLSLLTWGCKDVFASFAFQFESFSQKYHTNLLITPIIRGNKREIPLIFLIPYKNFQIFMFLKGPCFLNKLFLTLNLYEITKSFVTRWARWVYLCAYD